MLTVLVVVEPQVPVTDQNMSIRNHALRHTRDMMIKIYEN